MSQVLCSALHAEGMTLISSFPENQVTFQYLLIRREATLQGKAFFFFRVDPALLWSFGFKKCIDKKIGKLMFFFLKSRCDLVYNEFSNQK